MSLNCLILFNELVTTKEQEMELHNMLKVRDALQIIVDICHQEDQGSGITTMFNAMLEALLKDIEQEVERSR